MSDAPTRAGIEFRGVMLFARLAGAGLLDRILLPRARPGILPREGHPPKGSDKYPTHADGTPARPHHAGLAIWRGSETQPFFRLEPLRGFVEIEEDSSTSTPALFANLGKLARASRATNAGKSSDLGIMRSVAPDLMERASASIEIRGGAMQPSTRHGASDSRHLWRFPKRNGRADVPDDHLTLWYAWEASVPSATLRIRTEAHGASWPITLKITAADRVYIYSVDEPMPSEALLNKKELADEPEEELLVDHDYKWIYQVLVPGAGVSLREWIWEDESGRLPAPQFVPGQRTQAEERLQSGGGDDGPIEARHPTVSTCFPATWP